MATFFLVHGTFARNAEWTQPNSPLRASIEGAFLDRGEQAKFVPINWTGRNRGKDRRIAAGYIASAVASTRAQMPDEAIFLIGHSHGGSAIAFFLKNFEAERDLISGAIFLSTPFIALKPKADLEHRISLAFWLGAFALYFVTFNVARFLLQRFGGLDTGYYVLIALNLAFGAFCFYFYRSYDSLHGHIIRVWEKIQRTILENETCKLPTGHYRFIRYSGDEASMGLSFAQFMIYALNSIVEFAYAKSLLVVAKLSRNRLTGVDFPELILTSLIVLWLVFSPATIDTRSLSEITQAAQLVQLEKRDELLDTLIKLDEDFARREEEAVRDGITLNPYPDLRRKVAIRMLTIANEVDPWPVYRLYLFEGLGLLAATFLNVIAGISVLLLLLFASLRAFGSTELTQVLYVDLSVEILPYGDFQVVNLNWQPVEKGLMHSQAYASDQALDRLVRWVLEQV